MTGLRHPNQNPLHRLRAENGNFRHTENACTTEILGDLSFTQKENGLDLELPNDVTDELFGGDLNRHIVSFKKQVQLSGEVASGNMSIPKNELIDLVRRASKSKES